ncbi:MAG: shikimate kinase [Planctomycetota bacterium]
MVLIGARGAGKSTVGVALAARLGLPFHDTDAIVERETGRSIADMLADGSFRGREQAVLARVLASPPAVVAAGGGAVLWDGFAQAARAWRVVWLDADPEVLARRIRDDADTRPSLTGERADLEIEAVAYARAERYRTAAWRRVDTTGLSPDVVVDRIEKLLRGGDNTEVDNAD